MHPVITGLIVVLLQMFQHWSEQLMTLKQENDTQKQCEYNDLNDKAIVEGLEND